MTFRYAVGHWQANASFVSPRAWPRFQRRAELPRDGRRTEFAQWSFATDLRFETLPQNTNDERSADFTRFPL
jgi:hypothetical protein